MRLFCILVFLLAILVSFNGCGEDAENDEEPEEPADEAKNGDIAGTVIDEERGSPVEGASVSIDEYTTLTDADGKYLLKGIPFSDKIEVMVTADNYREYSATISLDQSLAFFDVSLAPVDSPTAQILDILSAFSQDVAALDPGKIQSILLYFSEDYIAANDPAKDLATFFGVSAGVVPPDYESIPDTVLTVVDKYDKLEIEFVDPDVTLNEGTASVLMRFEAYAETKPKPPDPAKEWEIAVNGRLDFRKEDGKWKITYWRLIPPFLKFEEEPLE